MTYNNHSILFFLFLSLLPLFQSQLTANYYQKTCPKFSEIVNRTVIGKQLSAPTTAAATLRLLFHDCMVGGCDASILVTSNSFNKAERDAEINLPLSGDGFDAVSRAKAILEMECPGVASCADILAIAARHLVVAAGGPAFEVLLGRKDSLESKAESSEKQFPLPTMPMSQVISIFTSKGFSVQEMVALAGAHTIGFSHCNQFSNRIFHFSKSSEVDPAYNPGYAEGLRKLCANYQKDPSMSAFNDVMTPMKFDNMYFKNLRRGLGLLASDSAMFADPRTRPFVDTYADDEGKFFQDFARAMEKLSVLEVKTGTQGEVRSRCDTFNKLNI
ncbi:peroxidase 31-like [Cajanus cajan]|uniref:peroxidase 31-like n=1 Tax=Cajanus cajan TaxID=3821 RepID=UPI00098D84AB|nr:peroxidase 31-like [Cajanus cajan]